ncbi:MAG: hypothetical protein R3C53_22705 [Pirellulaceae bacterium]
MGSLIENVKTLNSAVRTVLLAALVGVVGMGCYFGYTEYTARERLIRDQTEKIKEAEAKVETLEGDLKSRIAEIQQLQLDLKHKIEQIEKLETAMHLLKTDQRLAQLKVISIERDEAGKAKSTKLQFAEISPNGDPLSDPREFSLPGDVVYIDNWIVKFDDQYVESADIERGTSLVLFRRIFSEEQVPTEGFSLDEVGMRPQAYARGGALTEFEKKLWSDFWEFANDPAQASAMGIRAANGEAVSIKVREGKTYGITLRASGGLSIAPQGNNDATSDSL